MDLNLKSKIALVTASSKGIGKAAANSLAKEGATVIICSRKKNEIEQTAIEIQHSTNSEIIPFVADVSKLEDIQHLFEQIKKQFGTIHILVNNAGGPPTGDLLTMTELEWSRGYELTLMSMIRLSREALPFMIKQKWGRIITITSHAGKEPFNNFIASSTFRSGIHNLTKNISSKYAKDNITINTVCPGHILTESQKIIMEKRCIEKNISMEEFMTQISKDIPAGRLGNLEEVGNVIAFLASENASYINGINLLIDGGLTKGVH